MNKSILTTLAVMGIIGSQIAYAAPDYDEDAEDDIIIWKHDQMEKTLRQFSMVRGAWLGFNRGFYKAPPGSEMEMNCMNEQAKQHWKDAYEVYLGSND